MAEQLSFEDALEQIGRGEFSLVYYLTGSHDVLKDELVTRIVDRAVEPSVRDFNVDIRGAGDLDGESLHALVETPPMMADRRVAVVRGPEQWRPNARVWRTLDRYLESPSPTTILVLVHGEGGKTSDRLANAATHVQVNPGPDAIATWIARRAEAGGVPLSPTAVDHLLVAVDGNLSQAAAEIEKLAAVAPDGAEMEADVLGSLIGVRHGETVDDWVHAVLARDIPKAVAMLETVLGGMNMSGVRMITALGTALVGVRYVRALLDTGTQGRSLNNAVWEWLKRERPGSIGKWGSAVDQWTGAAQRWNSHELDQAIRKAFDADRALKSPRVTNEAGVVTGLILSMGARKAVA
jgi:DNA polymerase-3 subunit delta